MQPRPPTSELRIDPISGRRVLIAEERAGRPNEFLGKESPSCEQATTGRECPFCAGNEELTPEGLLEVAAETGSWQVRVVPNKYPAVTFAAPAESSKSAAPPLGVHEVFIESPRHVTDITDLSADELALILRVYRQRLRDMSEDKRIRQVLIFKNVGNRAGASLGHLHSQLVALPEIPAVISTELRASQEHFAVHQSCIFCSMLEEELRLGERLVSSNESFVAFCAYAGRQPYETWILPRSHQASYEHLTDAESEALAILLWQTVARLQTQLAPLAYNLILHTAPFGDSHEGHYHWHFELVPRSTTLAGFEWSSGMFINPLSPERAAAGLRYSRPSNSSCLSN